MELKTNVLYYGDNLEILRKHIPDESIDLIYLDPPFNSQADYNVLFKEPTGELSEAQLRAFSDTWHWDLTAERTYQDVLTAGPADVARMLGAMRDFIRGNDLMAYLVMMTARLIELRRILKARGCIYLHCDPKASHYLKVVMDTIFGARNFRNEIVWHYGQRTAFHKGHFSRKHDTLLFYAKSREHAVNPIPLAWTRDDFLAHRHDILVDTQGKHYIWTDGGRGKPRYKRYVDEVLSKGKPADSVWEMPIIDSAAKERLGYPTQKPAALLERIINASSNEGDVVLDPFCGCGTAVVAAHKLNRRWIGIDITHLAITVMKERLRDSFPGIQFEVVGEPADVAGAQALAEQDRYQFQWWALSLVNAKPVGDDKKRGRDKGVDGVIGFVESGGKAKRVIVQVKSGHVNPGHIRDLKGTMQREKAEIGLFLTLEPPTEGMISEAASAGFYHSDLWNEDYPRIQICTIEELLEGKQPKLPRWAAGGFPKAQKMTRKEGEQTEML